MQQKRIYDKTPYIGATNLRKPRKFTQPLVVMVETFRRSE